MTPIFALMSSGVMEFTAEEISWAERVGAKKSEANAISSFFIIVPS